MQWKCQFFCFVTCCIVTSFPAASWNLSLFAFILKLSYKEASWFALKYFRRLTIWTAVSTAVPALLFTLYFLLIPNETTEQALVGHKGWLKRDALMSWGSGHRPFMAQNKKNFSASLSFSRPTHNMYRTHKGKREVLQYVGINSWSTENRVPRSYFELFLTGEINRKSDLTLPGWLTMAVFP